MSASRPQSTEFIVLNHLAKHKKTGLMIKEAHSPYYTNQTIHPTFIVVHCVGYDDPLDMLKQEKVSTHYLVPQQKHIKKYVVYEVVPPPLRAWHAGISQWKNMTNLNDYAIGIELSMPNYAYALRNSTLDFLHFEHYPASQIAAFRLLVKRLQKQYHIPAKNVIGHADIAPWREIDGKPEMARTDPGPTFPWRTLARDGIGIYPALNCPSTIIDNLTATNAQVLLSAVGYPIIFSGLYDKITNLTLGAARLHWSPGCFNPVTGSAKECYEKPFDRELACALYNAAQDEDNTAEYSNLLILSLVGGGAIALLLLVWFLCQRYTRNPERGSYEQIRGDDASDDSPQQRGCCPN